MHGLEWLVYFIEHMPCLYFEPMLCLYRIIDFFHSKSHFTYIYKYMPYKLNWLSKYIHAMFDSYLYQSGLFMHLMVIILTIWLWQLLGLGQNLHVDWFWRIPFWNCKCLAERVFWNPSITFAIPSAQLQFLSHFHH